MIVKDFYKNPLFYYILAPALLALWPVFLWLVYLPATGKASARDQQRYEDAQPIIEEILTLDPDRLRITEGKAAGDQFDYANAVQKVAALNRLAASSYQLA